MKKIQEAQMVRDAALAHARAIADTANAAELRAASEVVERAQQAVSNAIVEGANVCPSCGAVPHGMQHPTGKHGFVYEIACLGCKPVEHDDGTHRDHRVRGGLMPKHAVEAWNGGPDFWSIARK